MGSNITSNNQKNSSKLYVRMYYSWQFRLMVFGVLLATLIVGGFILARSKDSKAATSPISCAKEISSGSINTALSTISPGSMLCLNGGTYNENLLVSKTINISSKDPNNKATIHGQIEFKPGSNGSRLQFLNLQGGAQAQAGILINSNNVTIDSNNIYNPGSRGICINIGTNLPPTYVYQVSGTLINANRIHNCGSVTHDQAIYVSYTANNPVNNITNNYLYDGPDFGIQFYPYSQGVVFEHNVIDGFKRGLTFSGEATMPSSSNNVARYNIISFNNGLGYNIESWWGGTKGTGNVANDNCLASTSGQNINTGNGGFTATNNKIVSDPLYNNRAGKDFSLKSGSPCAGYGPVTGLSNSGGQNSGGSGASGGSANSGGQSSNSGSIPSVSSSAPQSSSSGSGSNSDPGAINSNNNSQSSITNGSGQSINSNGTNDSSALDKTSTSNQGSLTSYIADKLSPASINSEPSALKSSPIIKILASYYALQVLAVLIKYTFF